MNEQEKKLYILLQDSMRRMAEGFKFEPSIANTISFLGIRMDGLDWPRFKAAWDNHIHRELGARFTSLRRNPSKNFYAAIPTQTVSLDKPTEYIEIKKDVGLKILALGYVP